MKTVSIMMVVLVFTPLIFAASEPNAASQVPDVQAIINKANIAAYYQGSDGKAKVQMTITSRQGQTRQREFIILRRDDRDGGPTRQAEGETGDQKYFIYFHKPADVRKMVYMVHKHAQMQKDDDRWLYMPALDLVKRIAAGDKRTSFVGSDFLYEDVSGRSLQEDTHELIDTTEQFFVVKNTPKNPDTVEFSYYNVAIDRKNFVPVKMEFYDKQGKLHRVIESKKVEVIQGFPTVVTSLVSDLKTGSKTEMKFSDVKYDIGLEEDIFTERYLRRPPREAMR